MLSRGEKIFMSLATGEFLLGILVNGFIVLVNLIEWIKSKKLPPSDLILISLAISRVGLLCILVCSIYSVEVSTDPSIQVKIIDGFLGVTQTSNIWFATVLNIFYFLKIANFSNPFFLWMKWRINKMIFKLLILPLIIYLFIGFAMMEKINYYYDGLVSRGKERNESQEVQVSKSMFHMLQVLSFIISFIPFVLSTVSLSLLIFSLWRHSRQMQVNATGFRDPSTEAHIRAMKAVSSFLILFLLYYMGVYFYFWSIPMENNKLISMMSTSIMFLYPFGHSVILILWNHKLRKAALRVSLLIRCFQRGSHLQFLWIIWHFLGGKKSA